MFLLCSFSEFSTAESSEAAEASELDPTGYHSGILSLGMLPWSQCIILAADEDIFILSGIWAAALALWFLWPFWLYLRDHLAAKNGKEYFISIFLWMNTFSLQSYF